jgi:hypothetical protein
MSKELQVDVAVVHEICPGCNKDMNEHLIIGHNLRTTTPIHDQVHNKAIGISATLCDECQASVPNGIMLIGVDMARTEDMSNPYKSGSIIGLTEEAFKRNFDEAPPMQKWCYIDTRIIDKILQAYKDLK